MMLKRHLLLALATLPAWHALRAQGNAPIRLWVGTPPGGSTDTIARELASELMRLLGRNVIVENKSGAGGNIAADAVAKSAPDGNNLLVSFTSHTINATLYKKLPYDPVADFTPLTQLVTSSSVLVAHPSLPVANAKELIDHARTDPSRQAEGAGRHQSQAPAAIPRRAGDRRGAAGLRIARMVRPVRPGQDGA